MKYLKMIFVISVFFNLSDSFSAGMEEGPKSCGWGCFRRCFGRKNPSTIIENGSEFNLNVRPRTSSISHSEADYISSEEKPTDSENDISSLHDEDEDIKASALSSSLAKQHKTSLTEQQKANLLTQMRGIKKDITDNFGTKGTTIMEEGEDNIMQEWQDFINDAVKKREKLNEKGMQAYYGEKPGQLISRIINLKLTIANLKDPLVIRKEVKKLGENLDDLAETYMGFIKTYKGIRDTLSPPEKSDIEEEWQTDIDMFVEKKETPITALAQEVNNTHIHVNLTQQPVSVGIETEV